MLPITNYDTYQKSLNMEHSHTADMEGEFFSKALEHVWLDAPFDGSRFQLEMNPAGLSKRPRPSPHSHAEETNRKLDNKMHNSQKVLSMCATVCSGQLSVLPSAAPKQHLA